MDFGIAVALEVEQTRSSQRVPAALVIKSLDKRLDRSLQKSYPKRKKKKRDDQKKRGKKKINGKKEKTN